MKEEETFLFVFREFNLIYVEVGFFFFFVSDGLIMYIGYIKSENIFRVYFYIIEIKIKFFVFIY